MPNPTFIKSRRTNWRALVTAADPDWHRMSNYVPEYEFSSTNPAGNMLTQAKQPGHYYQPSQRVFYGNYKERGPYAPDE